MGYIVEKDWITQSELRAVVLIVEVNGRKSHRCGYVGVPKESPFYGKGYSEQLDLISQDAVDRTTLGKKSPILLLTARVRSDDESNKIRRSLDIACDVHGGLTYADDGKEKYPVESDLWWFGFDCHHSGDAQIEPDPYWPRDFDDVVRDLPYVEAECESLAAQLKALTGE